MADREGILGDHRENMEDGRGDMADEGPDMETTPMMAPSAEDKIPSGPHTKVVIDRPIYDMNALKLSKQESTSDETLQQKLRKRITSCETSQRCFGKKCLALVPIATTFKEYRWKQDIIGDLIAGVTVGVMHLPMGLAFAILASLPVVYGLYASFWPTLLYAFLGTGRHVSIGTMAVMSLLLGTVVERASLAAPKNGPTMYTTGINITNLTADNATADVNMYAYIEDARVTAAIGATFVMGLIQILLSILQLGKIASFMSMSFISGFTAGAACHIVTSQIKSFLGLSLPRHIGIFRLPQTWYEIFRQIHLTHIPSLILSLIAIFILLFIKYAINDNPKLKPYLKIPVPAELIVVVIAAIISHFAKLNPKFNIKIIGEIPRGFPKPEFPDLSGASDYIVDSFIMAIVCFVISFAMASLFARKHSYDIDNNQEMFAYGICHSIGAIFFSFAGAAAPPRCMVLDGTGAKSQVAALFSSLVLLLIIVAVGPLFQPLPLPSLAAIVVCALIPMFKQFRDPYDYWKVSRYDTVTWIVTWCAVVFLDVTVGLGIGIAFSIFTISFQSFLSNGYALKNMTSTEVYITKDKVMGNLNQNGISVFRFEAGLHFATRERFKQQLMEATVNPKALIQEKKAKDLNKSIIGGTRQNGRSDDSDNSKDTDSQFIQFKNQTNKPAGHPSTQPNPSGKMHNIQDLNANLEHVEHVEHVEQLNLHTIIIDCSCISYMDMAGLHALKMICLEYKKAGVEIVLANCSISLLDTLTRASMQNSCPTYPTIHDAFLAALNKSYEKSLTTSNV